MRMCSGNTDLWLCLNQIQPHQSLLHQLIQAVNLTSLFPSGTVVKNPPANAGDARDAGLIPRWKRFPGVGNGNPFQYCCLENSTSKGTWWVTVHGVAKRRTRLSDWACMHINPTELRRQVFSLINITGDSGQFIHSVVSDSLRPHESQHARPPCPSPTPGVHWDSRPSSQWCHPAISSSVVPFSSCPQSLPAISLFQWVNSLHEVAKVLEFQV